MTLWHSCALGDAVELAYGKSLPKNGRSQTGLVPVYGSNGITGWHDVAIVNQPTVIVGRKGIPYYRQEQINARSGIHTPRSTLAAWSGQGGAGLIPLYDAHRSFVLGANVLHVDETPVNMLDPGAGKTKRAYIWAYARSGLDVLPGVVYDFCVGRGAKYPVAFLQDWSGTLVCDGYAAYDTVFKLEQRIEAGCLAHARRKFDELIRDNQSPVATQAVQRIAKLYGIEREARDLSVGQRLDMRQSRAKPLWEEMHVWLQLERRRVPDGSAIANAIDYSLNRWTALMANLVDGDVPIDNNHIENLMRPWAMGRKAWLFAGSELAGQRAAIVMSLVQSALCRMRHSADYADRRTMPNGLASS